MATAKKKVAKKAVKANKPITESLRERINEIEELLDRPYVNDTMVTIDKLTRELNQVLVLCKMSRQPAAMVGAIKLKAQLHGLYTEKSEVKNETTVNGRIAFPGLEERIGQVIEAGMGDALQ